MQAGWSLVPESRRRARSVPRWVVYLLAGGVSAATIGPWLVLVLVGCGLVELALSARGEGRLLGIGPLPVAAAVGGLPALAWVALKVGALSYGGGFVIVPLMQADAVNRYHWLTSGQFLNAVALGQVTPGPVVHTVAAVGYGAHGLGGGLLAALVAFTPSFAFVLLGAGGFQRLRDSDRAQAFLGGAGPAAAGAILGTAVPARCAPCPRRGSTQCSPAPPCSCSRSAAASCRRCSWRARSASRSPSPAAAFRTEPGTGARLKMIGRG